MDDLTTPGTDPVTPAPTARRRRSSAPVVTAAKVAGGSRTTPRPVKPAVTKHEPDVSASEGASTGKGKHHDGAWTIHLRLPGKRLLVATVVVCLAAGLTYSVFDDLQTHNALASTTNQLTSTKASHDALSSNVNDLQATNAGLQDQITNLQGKVSSLQASIPSLPNFVASGHGWNGPCDINDTCYPTATFVNHGATGSAVAIFTITPAGKTSPVLGSCSVAIPATPRDGAADAGCAVSSPTLRDYFLSTGGGSVTATTAVTNPSP